ncbi:MAG TPA: MotA/TolQ/ExbB proton channel family protein [Candidatus Sulfotelmatobacter sp.]|jgi:biopolymer transport protein ExbB|nr:MotA/TolQ/ExbB proton channel family protein [Candidatus Sulfotelmatobacter sp.]
MIGDLARLYAQGGPMMHPITACSVAALTVAFWKLAQFRTLQVEAAGLFARVRKELLNGRVREAGEECERSPGPTAAVLHAGILKAGAPREEVASAMEAAALYEVARLESKLGFLATVATVAPLLGFLGTVWGMIVAFDVIHARGLSDPARVAGGIAQALITTAWGLVVAVVAVPFHNYCAGRVTAQSGTLEMAESVLLETLSEMERMGTKA